LLIFVALFSPFLKSAFQKARFTNPAAMKGILLTALYPAALPSREALPIASHKIAYTCSRLLQEDLFNTI
jgi:hypothetical protein